ncbi:hypothetical protein HHL17_24555 [Chitinophaga sp. G-6-1-13]|uniref:Uncharacterized protein n=1 Tax=Chitinophaga fulva TaxID=2728842 RepID=A0A848GSB0_9BACT|nr:hypothetical protein [Chitinophaga fulva]NML40391.1 hypothetical protein [Chitinophaga fulva]
MPHEITAIILKGPVNTDQIVHFDLEAVPLTAELTLFHFNNYYMAYWEHIMGAKGYLDILKQEVSPNYQIGKIFVSPISKVVAEIMKRISKTEDPLYAIIITDYFGGIGGQWANVFRGEVNQDINIKWINEALRLLGVKAAPELDEFDTVGLTKIRVGPEYLFKYTDLCDEHGL